VTPATPSRRPPARPLGRALVAVLAPLAVALTAACTTDHPSPTAPVAAAGPILASALNGPTSFTLSSVTPPIVCTDASGATTTVTGGTLTLSPNGKFTATFTTQTSSGATVSTSSYTEKGTYSVSGSTITFKVGGGGTYTGTLVNGTLTIANYPLCGATHTAVFVQTQP
jgi:hypothetical protein